MSHEEFWWSSPRWAMAFIKGAYDRETRNTRNGWEQARLVAWAGLLPYDSDKKLPNPVAFLPFAWEQDTPEQVIIGEEQKAWLAEQARLFFGETEQ